MKNILTLIVIITFIFTSITAKAQTTITDESVSYKAVIAFKKNKKASKDFEQAFQNLQYRIEGYDVQVIKAKKKTITIAKEGKAILEVNVAQLIKQHDQGFLFISDDHKPQVLTYLDGHIVNEDTIVDIALISLGLNQYEDLVIAF